MTQDRMIELLKIERACVIKNNGTSCDRECEKCILCQDSEELCTMYNVAIDQIENRLPHLEKTIADMKEENNYLREEVKKRRKEKKKWKRKAIALKANLSNVRKLLEEYKEIKNVRA